MDEKINKELVALPGLSFEVAEKYPIEASMLM
jgi:hypothetical protein